MLFVASATAGEFGLSFVGVGPGDLQGAGSGGSAQRVREAFEVAGRHLPALLFFGELDQIAGSASNPENAAALAQLLDLVEESRNLPELIVMAATYNLAGLDPGVTHSGRFDHRVQVEGTA